MEKISMKSSVFALTLAAGLWLAAAPATAQGVPQDILCKLIIKLIGFDQNGGRFGSPITIGVAGDSMLDAFGAVRTHQINGRAFVASRLSSPADVAKFDVVVVAADREGMAAAVAAEARAAKVLSFSETRRGVEKGLGVGFIVQDGKPKIVVAPTHVATSGSAFPDTVLKLSLVI